MIEDNVFKRIKKGDILVAEYFLGDGRIRVKRNVKVTSVDGEYLFIETGFIRDLCLHRSDFIEIANI